MPQKDAISALNIKVLKYPIKEVRILFSRDLMSPEISEDEEVHHGNNSEEKYFVPSIPWCSNEGFFLAIFKVECQHQLKLCKDKQDINFEQFFTLDENNQITTDLQHILDSPYDNGCTAPAATNY
ncbi:hypothetical protein RhiirA4_476391 [Rhizophagus irregularis]|uniref:Uncharacterized protein n=1 Tax=Rhizophagus irregularis TaxID=588596 RepID=A0A2I1HBH3_9GLOM|nr:hypothetical protein RhiirA4_476391 [Rhizophagus irregularis]